MQQNDVSTEIYFIKQLLQRVSELEKKRDGTAVRAYLIDKHHDQIKGIDKELTTQRNKIYEQSQEIAAIKADHKKILERLKALEDIHPDHTPPRHDDKHQHADWHNLWGILPISQEYNPYTIDIAQHDAPVNPLAASNA